MTTITIQGPNVSLAKLNLTADELKAYADALASVLQAVNKLVPNKYSEELIAALQGLENDTLLLALLTTLINKA